MTSLEEQVESVRGLRRALLARREIELDRLVIHELAGVVERT